MLFYDITVSFRPIDERKSCDFEEQSYEIGKLNLRIANQFKKNDCMVFIYEYNEKLMLAMGIQLSEYSEVKKIQKKICELISADIGFENVKICSINEITFENFNELYELADDRYVMDKSYRLFKRNNSGLFNNRYYKASEKIITGIYKSKDQAIIEAQSIMADQSLLDEIERIYDERNQEAFYGIPVHYCITADGREAAQSIIEIIVKALCHKKRLPGGRICTFTDITEKCYDDDDFAKICKQSPGTSIVIELRGNDTDYGIFASSYNSVIDYLIDMVYRHKADTQFFFVRDITYEGFSNPLFSKLGQEVDVIDVREGRGGREEAEKYLNRLIAESRMSHMASEKDMRYLPRKKRYYPHEIYEAFGKWRENCLKERAYPAYNKQRTVTVKKAKRKKTDSYNELQEMVGLSNVKRLCDEIICSYKMQRVRERYGLDQQSLCRHMVFTGNPGSAKTTVARLLAEILADEGVLETGKLVECGRGDLVGRYVGWTAKTVKSKFWEAKGGMLFIDEAYSLVDDSRSFGDEAINTIVQEMENNRDKVIVVFAGYPDKMKGFLDRNEGLRSRIAFHVDFPDYDKDDLLGIMKNMVSKRGLEIDDEALYVCTDVLKRVCTIKDFGNGRFVRNYLEQAIMRQSLRIGSGMSMVDMKSITKEQAKRLTADDFMVDPKVLFEDEETKKKRRIGFVTS